MKQLESLIEVEAVEDEAAIIMTFPKPHGYFEKNLNLISVRNASFSWSPDVEPLFQNVDFCVGPMARMAILGRNGCGKIHVWLFE